MFNTQILVIVGLVLLNGFFSMSEMALVSSKRARLQAAAERGSSGAKVALQLLADPTNFLSAVQVGITLIGILTGVYSGATFAQHLATVLGGWGVPLRYADDSAYALVVTAVTFLSLILGELVPKRVALSNAERLAIFVAPIMRWFAVAMTPLVWVLRGSVNLVLKLIPVAAAPQSSVTEDEVRSMIAEATHHGVFLASEKKMIEGVLALADRKVESIMVQRLDVIWLDLDEPVAALWEQAKSSGHARFIVARGGLDNLVGIVTLANLSEALRRGGLDEQADFEPPLHVPVGISAMQLLNIFQRSSSHLALVTDEYGDIAGVATPIDLLRAIAGELRDIGSRERAEMTRREDGSWLVDGHLPIEELQQQLGRKDMLSASDYHTVAGFVLARLGRIPKAADVLTWRDLKIEVIDMDGTRIDKLLIASTSRGKN
ncbi:MAG: HlyC/CorC family transporter [Candidatus Obscuribacterales bacterium]|nr:HlyC/CorC family transporter [Steroidobacteraceae bacterium]